MSDEKLYGWRARGLDGAKACEHGRQRRQCPECESASLDEELRIKDARIALLEKVVVAADEVRDDLHGTLCSEWGEVTADNAETIKAYDAIRAEIGRIE